MRQENFQKRERSELIINQVSKFVHRIGSRFWFTFTLFNAMIFGSLALVGLVSGELLFALSAFVTGSLFCAGGIIFYRYCKIMLNLTHQNDIYKW